MKTRVTPGKYWFEESEPEIIIPPELTGESPLYNRMKEQLQINQTEHDKLLNTGRWLAADKLKRERIAPILRFFNNNLPGSKKYRSHWYTLADRIQRVSNSLISALNRNTVVRWHIPADMGTDCTTWNEQKKRWEVYLNINRLKFEDNQSTTQTDPSPHMIQSTIGVALHELSHTLYSPEKPGEACKTYEAHMIYRAYEDIYINHRTLKKLPGAGPFFDDAHMWSNPAPALKTKIKEVIKEGISSFEDYCNLQTVNDYTANISHKSPSLDLPDDECLRIHQEFQPYVEKLTTGLLIPLEERMAMYQEMADIISKEHSPEIHSTIPTIQYTINDNGGTETPLDQFMDSNGKSTLQDLIDSMNLGSCSSLPENNPGKLEADYTIARSLNDRLEDSESDNVSGIEGLNYAKTKPTSRGITPKVKQSVVDAIRSIFRTRYSERRNYVHGLPEGKLSTRKLHKLLRPTTDLAVFRRRPKIDSVNTAVLFLVDASGSMSGAPYETAITAAETMFQALKYNRDYKVYIWIYSGGYDGVEVISPIHDETIHWPTLPGGGTPSYLALGKAYQFLSQNAKSAHKVIIHFTDAYPGNEGEDSEWFLKLRKDNAAAYASVAVIDQRRLDDLKAQNPKLNLMSHTTEHLPKAINEFIINHAG